MAENNIAECRNELEAEISRAVIRFEKECMGRGPVETRTYILGDLILVRLKGVMTPAEQKLATASNGRSSYLLKQVRNQLLEDSRPMLESTIKSIVQAEVISVHTDISTKTGERVIVITLDRKISPNNSTSDAPTR